MSVTVLYYKFYFAYSMLSVVDELCMPAYINVRRFHWILLIIRVDYGIVETLDSLGKDPREYASVVRMLDR